MKRIFTLLLGTIFSLSLLAYDGTRLTINTVSKNKMTIEIDGRRYNMDKNNTVSIRDLSAGRHTVRIYHESRKNNNSIFNRNRQEVIYNQSVILRRDYHLDITINRFGKVMVDERRIDRNDDWYDDDDNYDRDNRRVDPRDDRWNKNNGRQMGDLDFNQAKETLRREWYENTRVTTARQIIDRNYFSVYQIKELLQLFSFEANKLDLAKYAYGKATDRRNYHIVNDVFAHTNSRDELARYIRDYR